MTPELDRAITLLLPIVVSAVAIVVLMWGDLREVAKTLNRKHD